MELSTNTTDNDHEYFDSLIFIIIIWRNLMGILSWIVFGLIAGALAKWIMPGNDSNGAIITILLGIAGAVLGGWIGTTLGYGSVSGFNISSLGIAIVGSLVLLGGYRLLRN